MKQYKAEVFDLKKNMLGESPFYDEKTDTFSWVDIIEGKFYKKTGEIVTVEEFHEQIGAAVLSSESGIYYIAGTKAIYKLDASGKREVVYDLTKLLDETHRCNDAKFDPMGRLFFGSSSLTEEPSGDLYCYDFNEMKKLQKETKISNGMAWNKDQTKFYFSDSPYQQVFVYDYDAQTGEISNRQPLCDITNGVPDGLTIDEEDNIWVAIWDGSRVECHDGTTGELLAVIDVPAKHTTSCIFYGEKKDRLFITSAGEGLDGEFDGCLFTCKVK